MKPPRRPGPTEEHPVVVEVAGVQPPGLREWAERIAATLPPLTAEEIAVLGRLAAELDARLREQKEAGAAPDRDGPGR